MLRSLIIIGIQHGGKKMAFSEIKNLDLVRDQGFSTIFHIPGSESGRQNSDETAIYKIDAGKRPEALKDTTEEKIARIAELMDSYVRSMQSDINIQVNNRTGDISVKVISKETGKVIREIPSQEMLELAARMEEISGVFFDQKV
jgi:flagellar protein FlaG